MDRSEALDLFPRCGKRFFLLSILAQVLEFSGGILLLIEKAKTTLESMAADAVTDGNLRSGSPLPLFYPQEPLEPILLNTLIIDLTLGLVLKVQALFLTNSLIPFF